VAPVGEDVEDGVEQVGVLPVVGVFGDREQLAGWGGVDGVEGVEVDAAVPIRNPMQAQAARTAASSSSAWSSGGP
jgi:hypothetical protein